MVLLPFGGFRYGLFRRGLLRIKLADTSAAGGRQAFFFCPAGRIEVANVKA